MKNRSMSIPAALALCLAWPVAIAEDTRGAAPLYDEVRDRITERYGGKDFDPDRWLGKSSPGPADVAGLIASLDDSSVRLLSPDDARRFFGQMQAPTAPGIGLIELLCIDYSGPDRRITVITPVPGTPAAAADVRTGDVILSIGGVATRDMSLHEAAVALQGKEGSLVELSIDRRGAILDKRIPTAPFPGGKPVVRSALIDVGDRRVGYVGILRFAPGSAAEAERALIDLQAAGMDALVLDLRNNPGGALQEAITVTELFLKSGDPIASLHGRSGLTRSFPASREPVVDVPMAVLVNAGTASASELVAGALQAHKRGRLFGERSAGKGLVHGAETLSDGTVLMMPIGRLMTPQGIDILGKGLTADTGVADTGTPVVHSKETTQADRMFWQAAHVVADAENTRRSAMALP